MKRRTLLAAAAGSAVVACAPGSHQEPTPSPEPAAVANPDIAALGDVTLTVWDQEVRGGQNAQVEELNARFQDAFPNVTVRRLSQSFDDLRKQITLALSGGVVPDVVQVNNARADMGSFVRAGQLMDLSRFASSYGWHQRFPASALSKMRYSTDGVTFGDGSLYGVPQTGEIVGMYYRQSTLDGLGGQVPGTWEHYFELLDLSRGAGLQPMVLGNLEKWPALHVFGPLQAAFVPAAEIVTLAMGNAGASWSSEGNREALAKFAAWGAEDYLGDSPNGTDYESAWLQFAEGKAAFLPAGSWLAADLQAAVGDGLRFMAPPMGVDGGLATTGGTGVPWSIPARAEHPQVAAAYLDFITDEAAMETIAAHGGMPVLRTAELAPETGVLNDVFQAFATVSRQGTLLPYLDYATPTFGDTAGAAFQELIGGQKDPEAVAATLQADYADFTAG
ncbi:extracellular solute-binding protein [Tessaracoccus lubricantis]|uniref:Extracellular solute-binding protein n=1 Tax=Tessaracoccus lubricantis TaxID=545543 RepID=A0ABP9EVL3_9ACTN